jgi:hypothetical protein
MSSTTTTTTSSAIVENDVLVQIKKQVKSPSNRFNPRHKNDDLESKINRVYVF